jgi:MFS family permease
MTTCFVIAAIWRLKLKETMTNKEPIRFRYFISSYPIAIKESFNVWKAVPKSMFWLLISQILTMFGISLFNVINALYARDTLGVPESQWWIVFIPLLLTMVVAAIPVGKTVDKVGRKIPLILGLLVFSIGATVFVFGTLFTLMIAMILFGLGSLLFGSGMLALTADLVSTENRGKVSGFTNFTNYIMSGIGMLLGNYLYVSFFPQLPFYIAIALMLPTLVIVLFLVHEPTKRAD